MLADNSLSSVGLLRRIGVGHLGDAANGCSRRRDEVFADIEIKQVLQVVLSVTPSSKPRCEIALQAAFHRSSVSRSDFACSAIGVSWMFAISFTEATSSRYVPLSN
jgi:hypothetical protein